MPSDKQSPESRIDHALGVWLAGNPEPIERYKEPSPPKEPLAGKIGEVAFIGFIKVATSPVVAYDRIKDWLHDRKT